MTIEDIIDRLHKVIENLRDAYESGRWYEVEDAIEDLEDIATELWGIALKRTKPSPPSSARA